MSLISILGAALATIGLSLVLGAVAGIFRAAAVWTHRVTFNQFNKRGGQSFVILSGSPETVQAMYNVCIRIAENINKAQAQPQEGIPVNDAPSSSKTKPKA